MPTVAALALSTIASAAGPCTQQIAQVQAPIDAKLAANAAAGPSAAESSAALRNRQPTPRSIAEAESKLGEISPELTATLRTDMARAREADLAGDQKTYETALAAALLFAVQVAMAKSRWSSAALIAARVNLWLGAIVTIFTVAAGIQAFLSVPHSETQTAPMVDHRNWAIATAIVWWAAALWAGWSAWQNERVPYALTGLLVVSMIPLLVTGWKGAELVYRHGVGVVAAKADAAATTG